LQEFTPSIFTAREDASHETQRSGIVAIFALLLMVSLMAFVAFAVDCGYLLVARTELQRTADARRSRRPGN